MCRRRRIDVIILFFSLLVIVAPNIGRVSVCLADDLAIPLNDSPILLPNHDYSKFKLIPPLTVTLPYLLPPAYDLRTVGRAAPGRESLGCASCWSSAVTYIMESLVMPDAEWDFSENHMQLLVAAECQQGSRPWMAQGYLTAWRGPVAEEDYNGNDYLKIMERAHVQNTTYLPKRRHSLDNNWIKNWVYHYGALYATAAATSYGSMNEYNAVWRPVNSATHAVVIVGWDDHFGKEKFTYTYQGVTHTPPGDGAFIAKDNVGPHLGENGFIYISYYDGTIGYHDLVGFKVEPVSNYKRIYQHDPLGTSNFVSRVRMPGYIPEVHGPLKNIGANVFTAVDSEELAAIGVPVGQGTPSNNKLECSIEIHLDPGITPVSPNGPELSFKTTIDPKKYTIPKLGFQAKSIELGGYYTIPLPQKIKIEEGQRFSVIISLTHGNWDEALSVEDNLNCYNCSSEPGQSFFSADGLTWYDLTEFLGRNGETGEYDVEHAYGNLGIKAYSVETSDEPFFAKSRRPVVKKHRSVGHIQNTIEIVNENMRPMTIKPIIGKTASGRKRRMVSYIDDSGSTVPITDSWIEIGPLETVKIDVPYDVKGNAGKNAFKVLWRDWDNNIQLFRNYRFVNRLTLRPLQLISTNPGANTIAPPELSIIRAVFNRQIKPGPGFMQIRLTSEGVEESISCSVSGKELYITPTGPLSTFEDGGKQWTVTLPADGVTDIHGTTLGQATSWTFTVQGVN